MNKDYEKEFPLIPKEFWEQPKEKIRIQNILVADGGAGQNFMLKLICESLDLPLFSEKWEFNEYNVGYPPGMRGAVFAWLTVPFAPWFNGSQTPVFPNSAELALKQFKRDVVWDQPWIKSHATPVQMFELFDVEYDNMIIVDQTSCVWFFKLLATIKQRCQNNMKDGRQFRAKQLMDQFRNFTFEMMERGKSRQEVDVDELEMIMKLIATDERFKTFFKYNSVLSWDTAMMSVLKNIPYDEAVKEVVRMKMVNAIDKERTHREKWTKKINKEFLEGKENVYFFQYDQFFFDLDFGDCPAFDNTSKEEVRLYSLENIELVRKFLNIEEGGYEFFHDQLDEWEERCWNA